MFPLWENFKNHLRCIFNFSLENLRTPTFCPQNRAKFHARQNPRGIHARQSTRETRNHPTRETRLIRVRCQAYADLYFDDVTHMTYKGLRHLNNDVITMTSSRNGSTRKRDLRLFSSTVWLWIFPRMRILEERFHCFLAKFPRTTRHVRRGTL
jgi:hypothetical protein